MSPLFKDFEFLGNPLYIPTIPISYKSLGVGVLSSKEILPEDIMSLASAEDIARFFATLGYHTNARTKQTASNINITGDEITRQITDLELIADQDSLLQVYLFELKSVTVVNTQTIARAMRNLPVNVLLVLTTREYDRIDFVLLEKVSPKESKKGPTAKQVGVIPRVLSIQRRNPGKKELRLLRRLTYTEPDPWAQYTKLVSAFSMIGWTEEFFTNRALFSDYVLKIRLPEHDAWKENPTDAFKEITKINHNASKYYSEKRDRCFFVERYAEPMLKALGFNYTPNEMPRSDGEVPDYTLYLPEEKDKPVAGICVFPWDRALDYTDEAKDLERGTWIPGQYVVRLLEKENLPWIIITNGKYWRLYSKKTHSKATEFYEVDLEEILAMEDPDEAFRYFWLMFRAETFKPMPYSVEGEAKDVALLDRLFLESEAYAKQLGEKLKDNIFKNIFPKFAKGFIVHVGGSGKYLTMDEAERDENLALVFRGTLTFLYRLLFLFYAESRDLLPVREVRGYWEVSLQKMREDVASKAGSIRDTVPESLKKGYGASETSLYDRLTEIFEIVDKGSPRLNVPMYNGGLFFTAPSAKDESIDAQNARFLKSNKIPDRFLAEGIDLLAREIDEKTGRLEFIDYKSLGVRQLGSIYEGLLEFRVRVASEDLAVIKGKKTDEYVPLAEAKKPKEIIKKSEVYLENDQHERKATGSYYTPDYVVKYIVENTVGPVLTEKLDKLKPRLRSHAPDPTLVDELFEVRVLDPAMGSGHFLVETVDFVTDKMVDYLSRFPNNPVQMEIDRTREEIISEMDRHKISIDPARLNDLNLLRRHVLKRCIYGVDLNPMAVELAKVSLWLHCFTLGAPLSFLDHHLKCGNSLIGAKVGEVAKAIESGQMTLLSTSRFGGVNKATDMMLKIGELSDVTPDQVKKSRESYETALAAIEPYKLILDVYTSQWFGNEAEHSRGKKAKILDRTLAFLKSEDSDKWLKDSTNLKKLSPEYRQIVETAISAARNSHWRFFHWELEFPEIWYEKGKRKENPGFDAVVGNPPYVRQEGIVNFKLYFEKVFSSFSERADIFVYFIENGFRINRIGGRYGIIVSDKWMRARYGAPLRSLVSQSRRAIEFLLFGELPVFEEAGTFPSIFISSNQKGNTQVKYIRIQQLPKNQPLSEFIKQYKISYIQINELGPDGPWILASPEIHRILSNISYNSKPLCNEINKMPVAGIKTGRNSIFILHRRTAEELTSKFTKEMDIIKPYIIGDDIDAYYTPITDLYLIFPYKKIGNEIRLVPIEEYPAIHAYLLKSKKELESRAIIKDKISDDQSIWYSLQQINKEIRFSNFKIIYPDISKECRFSLDKTGRYVDMTCFVLESDDSALISILNSTLAKCFFNNLCAALGDPEIDGRLRFKTQYVSEFPLRHIYYTTPSILRTRLVEEMKSLYQKEADDKILLMIEELLPKDAEGKFIAFKKGPKWKYDSEKKEGEGICPEKSDVVHDFLAFLAERMIELTKENHAEQTRFLGWLESQLSIRSIDDAVGLDGLIGKTDIKGYLGNYQKGEEESTFERVMDILLKNKGKIGANLCDPRFEAKLKTGYEKSLVILRPIKEGLRKTDWLIDQIVYRLYGLTKDEMAIVEGRQE